MRGSSLPREHDVLPGPHRRSPAARCALALAVLLGAVLLAPVSAPAAPAGCRFLATQSGMIGDIRTVISAEAAQQPPVTLRLTFRMQASGAVRGGGEIRAAAGDGSAITTATVPFAPVLVAASQIIETTCADLDGDGAAGLTSLSLDFLDPATGTRIPVELQSPRTEIFASGVYETVLRIGTQTFTSEMRVKLTRERDRPPRRR